MMLEYFKDMVSGIEARLLEDPEGTNARKKYALEIAKLGTKLYSDDSKIAWCGIMVPFDLLNAMGTVSCFVEFVASMLSSTGSVDTFLEEAEHSGYAIDTCAYHRAVLGAVIKKQMPVPDFLIATSSPCSGGLAIMEILSKEFRKELLVLDIPQTETKQNIQYLVSQLKNMVEFITRHTGKPLDQDRLREVIENANKTRELMIEVQKLAQHVPSPVNGRILRGVGQVISLILGSEAAVEIMQAYKDEFSNIINNGDSGVPGEKLRLMWIQGRMQFKYPIEELLENKYQAAIVIEHLNDITWEPIDPDDPFPGMARRMIAFPYNGDIKRRVKQIQKLARSFRINGAISSCHWGCRQSTGARGLITNGMKDIGIPVLNLEVDCIDPRNFAEGQVKTRIEAFMEMLENRPSPWQ